MELSAAGAIAMKSAAMQSAIGVAVQRIGIEADREIAGLVANVAQAAKAPPASGLGAIVDRQA